MKKTMKRFTNKLKGIAGVSFLEIMIALGITSFVTAAIFRLYVTQHQHYMVQDDITEVQQNARASIDQLARTIRMAGYATPVGLTPIQAYNTNSDTIVLAYKEDGCEASTLINMPNATSPIICGSSVACFSAGQWVYIYHPDSGGSEWFQISSVDPGTNSIFHTSYPLSKAFPLGAIVATMKEVKFYVDTTTNPTNPALMVQNRGQAPIVFADNIVDLQFRYKMKNGMTIDQPVIIEDVREVLISLTGRSQNPNVEDVNNPYKFRTFNTTVGLRNLAL
jgi:Tfp pilus assembly protein PilW